MPRKIYLLRHAQAESGFNIVDKERNLTELGKQQAFNVGVFLKSQDIQTVLCSSATRTQQTLEEIKKAGASFQKTDIMDQLYNAPADVLSKAINDTEENVIVIAHNPGIHQLAFQLSENSDQDLVNQLAMGYPPASLAVFEGDQLIDLIIPD